MKNNYYLIFLFTFMLSSCKDENYESPISLQDIPLPSIHALHRQNSDTSKFSQNIVIEKGTISVITKVWSTNDSVYDGIMHFYQSGSKKNKIQVISSVPINSGTDKNPILTIKGSIIYNQENLFSSETKSQDFSVIINSKSFLSLYEIVTAISSDTSYIAAVTNRSSKETLKALNFISKESGLEEYYNSKNDLVKPNYSDYFDIILNLSDKYSADANKFNAPLTSQTLKAKLKDMKIRGTVLSEEGAALDSLTILISKL